MKIATIARLGLPLLLVSAFASGAHAQRLSVSLGVHGQYGALGLSFGAPAPMCPAQRPRVWIPGRYELSCERVWIPGSSRNVWVPPVYREHYEYPCEGGFRRRVRVLVSPGYWRTVTSPGHYESRSVRVWQPGHWAQ